jgi:radical SAM protein with 4Fe4S-binding SPASM domain
MVVRELTRLAWESFVPLSVTIEVTEKCNFKCQHCYNYDRSKPHLDRNLDLAKLKVILTDLRTLGCLHVSFTGGEPLTYPELHGAIEAAVDLQMSVGLKSNASLFTAAKIEALKQSGLSAVELSLYGHSVEVVQRVTKNSFSGDKFFKVVDTLKASGISVQVNIILTSYSFGELDLMIQECQDRNVSYGLSYDLTQRYDGSQLAQELVISESQLRALLSRKELGLGGGCAKNPDALEDFQCGCARLNCAILSDGTVYPCMGAPMVSGNVFTKSIIEIWRESPEFNWIRGLKAADFSKCTTCSVSAFCNRSSGNIYSNTGDYTGCDPMALQIARTKAELSE